MALKFTRHHLFGMLLGVGVGLLIGFGIKAGHAAYLAKPSASERPEDTAIGLRPDQPNGLALQRSSKDQALAEALERSSRTQHWLWLATQAETAQAHEMPRLLRLAGDDYELAKMLGAHWAKLDRQHMLGALMEEMRAVEPAIPRSSSLLRQLFRDWAEIDTQGLADALSDDATHAADRNLRWSAIDAITREDPGLGLTLLSTWRIDSYTPSMRKVTEWAAKDPVADAAVIAKIHSDHVREDAMNKLGEAWAKLDPGAALEHAHTALSGGARRELVASVMQHWSKEDLDGAITYASTQEDPMILAAMSGPLAAAWAKTDPEAALAWSEESLTSAARANAIGAIIASVSKEDLANGRSLVTELAPGNAKRQAAKSLLETWITQDPPDGNAIGTWLAGLNDSQAQTSAIQEVQWDWTRKHPESAKAFIASEHGHLATSSMVNRIAANEVRADPHAALEWAATLDGEQRTRAQSSIAREWYETNPTAAIKWVTRETTGDLQTQAIESISKHVVFQSKDRLRAWIDGLNGPSRKIAREAMNSLRLPEKHAAKLEKVFP